MAWRGGGRLEWDLSMASHGFSWIFWLGSWLVGLCKGDGITLLV